MHIWVVHLDAALHLTDLGWFIDRFDVNSDTEWIVGILRVIAVEVPHSLFHARTASPMVHKLREFFEIHEGDVVEVTEDLALKDDRLRDTTLATTLWVWWMVLAVVVDGIPLVLRVCTVLAFLVACVCLCTLFTLSSDIAIEGLVLSISDHAFIFVHTVGALLIRSVVAAWLGRHHRTRLSNAVGAFGGGCMIAAALRLFLFLLLARFSFFPRRDSTAHTMDALLGGDVMAPRRLA